MDFPMNFPKDFLKGIFIVPHNFEDPENLLHAKYADAEIKSQLFINTYTKVQFIEVPWLKSEEDSFKISEISQCSGTPSKLDNYLLRKFSTKNDIELRCENWKINFESDKREVNYKLILKNMNESEITSFRGSGKQFDDEDLDIVIFLQAMEIERLRASESYLRTHYESQISILTTEKTSLEVRMRTFQSSSTTSVTETRWREEKTTMEYELRTLREECSSYSSRVSYLIKENTRISAELERFERQTSSFAIFKANHKDLESKVLILTQEIERLNSMLKTKSEGMQVLELRNTKLEVLIAEHERRIKSMREEITRHTETISIKHSEIDKLKFEYSRLDGKFKEVKNFESKKKFYEKKISLLLQENEHLKAISRKKTKEIDEWYAKYMTLESSLNEIVQESKSMNVSTTNTSGFKGKASGGEDGSQNNEEEKETTTTTTVNTVVKPSSRGFLCKFGFNSTKSSVVRIPTFERKEFQHKIKILTQELEHANSMSKLKTEEYEKIRILFEKEQTRNEELVTRINELEGEVAKAGGDSSNHTSTTTTTTTKKKKNSGGSGLFGCCDSNGGSTRTSSTSFNSNSTNSAYLKEISSLKVLIKEKEQEVGRWTFDYGELERKLKEILTTDNQKEEMTQQIISLEQRISIVTSEKHRYEEENTKLKIDSEKLAGIYIEITRFKSYISELELKVRLFEKDRSRLAFLEGRTEIFDRMMMIVFFAFSEIERLGIIVRTRDFDLEKWRADYYKLEVAIKENTTVQFLNEEITRYKHIIEEKETVIIEKSQEITGLSIMIKEFRGFESTSKDLTIKIEESYHLIDEYKEEIRIHKEEILRWKESYSKLEVTINEYKSWEIRYQEADFKFISFNKEIERLNIIISEKVLEIDKYKASIQTLEVSLEEYKSSHFKIEEFDSRIGMLNLEIERLNTYISTKDHEIEKWRSEYKRIEYSMKEYRSHEIKVTEFESRLKLLTQEIERLHIVLKEKDSQINALYTEKSKSETMIYESRSYKSQITEISEKTTFMSSEITRLNNYIRQKEEELYYMQSQYKALEVKIHQNQSFSDFEMKIALMTQEITRLNALISEKDKRYIELKNSSSSYSSSHSVTIEKISFMTQEIERLTLQLQNRDRDIHELRNSTGSNKIVEEKYQILQSTVTQLTHQINDQLALIVILSAIADSKGDSE